MKNALAMPAYGTPALRTAPVRAPRRPFVSALLAVAGLAGLAGCLRVDEDHDAETAGSEVIALSPAEPRVELRFHIGPGESQPKIEFELHGGFDAAPGERSYYDYSQSKLDPSLVRVELKVRDGAPLALESLESLSSLYGIPSLHKSVWALTPEQREAHCRPAKTGHRDCDFDLVVYIEAAPEAFEPEVGPGVVYISQWYLRAENDILRRGDEGPEIDVLP